MLDECLAELTEDYNSFVCVYAPAPNDSLVSVSLRFSLKRTVLAMSRLRKNVAMLMRCSPLSVDHTTGIITFHTRDRARYLEANHVPPRSLYHHSESGLRLVADLPHAIFIRGLFEHIMRLRGGNDGVYIEDETTPLSSAVCNDLRKIPIIYRNPAANALLNYACSVASFPAIPPDLAGNLRSTLEEGDDEWLPASTDRVDLDMTEPGVDSRCYVKDLSSPRACVSCRIENLAIGQTDVLEQGKRAKCRCVMASTVDGTDYKAHSKVKLPYFEGALSARATVNARVACVSAHRNGSYNELVGCSCAEHKSVIANDLARMKRVLEMSNVGG